MAHAQERPQDVVTSVPSRVWIVGPPGAGKSTVGRRVASVLGIEPTHLDDLFWLPGWRSRPPEEFLARVRAVVEGPSWVIDGNYRAVRTPLWDRAQLVVWLDLPFAVVTSRVALRTFRRAWTGEPVCNGNRESVWKTLFHRDSILWWTVTQFGRYRSRYPRELAARPHVRLRSQGDVDRWLEESFLTESQETFR